MTGQIISHYEILEQLGSGGMGVVYKARDTKLDRIVALKFLPPKVARDEEAKQRFMQEAKAASALDDPHICTIFEIGEADDGQLFIAMAYYDGSTLQDLIERRKIKIDDAASIARQMAKGLATAHEAGIVHRDVKPANVMVTRKGLVKLLDFGVAKLGESSDLTREGSTIGTASYMSPEQARGEQVDARSDIWSIGAVLYEMLTGARPFGGGYEAAVAYSIINEDPPPIAPARPDTPEGLVDVVDKALSKNADERYPTARALAEVLGIYSGETIVETAPQPAYKAPAEDATPSLQNLVLKFAIGGALALAVVYAAMIGLGLPDWVFPAAVFLTLVGLPITLYGASLEKKRAKMDSGEREGLSGLQKSFSSRKALRGGVLAGTGLVLVIVAYSVLRMAGVGPFASLITAGVLEDNGLIIVADFENRTDTRDLGMTVSEALRIDLSQSTAVTVMGRTPVRAALSRMQLSPDTLLSAGIALRLAQREGVKAIIEGEITSVGSSYQIAARVLSSESAEQIFSLREAASAPSDVLPAIDRLSKNIRAKIGESLVDLRSNPPLAQVSTPSLAALAHYTAGNNHNSAGHREEAIAELELAIQEDSLFGMAYRKLSIIYDNIGSRQAKRDSLATQAFALRNRMTERERLITEGTFWSSGGVDTPPDAEKSEAAYRAVLNKWPNDLTALNNLSILLYREGELEEHVVLLEKVVALNGPDISYRNLSRGYLLLGQRDDLESLLEQHQARFPDVHAPLNLRIQGRKSFLDDSLDAAFDWYVQYNDWRDNDGSDFTLSSPDSPARIRLAQGRLEEFERLITEWFDSPEFRRQLLLQGVVVEDEPESTRALRILDVSLDRAMAEAELGGDTSSLESWLSEVREWRPGFDFLDPNHLLLNGELNSFQVYRSLKVQWILDPTFESSIKTVAFVDSLQDAGQAYNPLFTPTHWTVFRTLVLGLAGDDVARRAIEFEEALPRDLRRTFKHHQGQLWEKSGDELKAIQAYTEFVSATSSSPVNADQGWVAKIHYRLGELHEQQGNLDQAIFHYQKMVDRWKDADAILQPQVEEARRRIDQLLDQKAQEPN